MGTGICVGGGQHSASSYSTSAQAYVVGFGYSWNPADPFASVYALIFSQYRPVGQAAGGAWDALAEACMRTRNMLFCNNTPDDCGTTQSGLSGQLTTLKNAAGLGISGAAAGISIANAAGAGISSIAGAVIPGVGALLSGILAVYQKHVAAEAAQETQLCSECPAVTTIMRQIDAAVASGSATGEQGYSAMAQLSTQFIGALSGIFKSGNAADGYERIFKCQVALSLYLYGVSPLPPNLSSGSASVSENSGTVANTNSEFSAGTSESDESASYEVPGAAVAATTLPTGTAAALPSAPSTFNVGIIAFLAVLIGVVLIWGFSE